jgi:hypothetical protein
MSLIVRNAVLDDELEIVGPWRSCDLVASGNNDSTTPVSGSQGLAPSSYAPSTQEQRRDSPETIIVS